MKIEFLYRKHFRSYRERRIISGLLKQYAWKQFGFNLWRHLTVNISSTTQFPSSFKTVRNAPVRLPMSYKPNVLNSTKIFSRHSFLVANFPGPFILEFAKVVFKYLHIYLVKYKVFFSASTCFIIFFPLSSLCSYFIKFVFFTTSW